MWKGLNILLCCALFTGLHAEAQNSVIPDSNPAGGKEVQSPIPIDSAGYLTVTAGTVNQLGGNWILVTKSPRHGEMRYMPQVLPAEFRKDGMEVAFHGVVGSIPPHVRLAGTPIAIKDIRKLEYAEPPED